MHGNGIDDIVVCLVVLDQPIGAQVEYFDLGITAASGQTRTVGVEDYVVDTRDVVLEHCDLLALVDVPHTHGFVVRARC